MYVLERVSFDYYAWHDAICVSESKEKLEDYHRENVSDYPLYDKEKSFDICQGRSEEYHYTIIEIEHI